jgi:signal peptidase II
MTLAFVLDQLTKRVALRALRGRPPVEVFDDFFWLTLVRNPHGAFGLFSGLDQPWRKAVLVALPALSVIFFTLYFLRHCRHSLRQVLAFGLVTGGAWGNLYDRLTRGKVIDFLDFHWRDLWHWPAFNLADGAVTTGVALLVLDYLLDLRARRAAAPAGVSHASQTP